MVNHILKRFFYSKAIVGLGVARLPLIVLGLLLPHLQPAAVRCDMVLHRACRARHVRQNGIGGEVRHGVTSGVSCETSLNKRVTPHLCREYSPSLLLRC